jgi:Carboxypeptidase regulatory-like domain
MKLRAFQTLTAAVACVGMVLPQAAFAVQPVPQSNDVALRPGGLVVGQVVDPQGVGQAAATVSIQQGQQEVVRTRTDQNGVFAAQGLRGGQYQVVTEQGQGLYRFWAPDTAPPAAQQTAVVVTSPDVVRGQYGYGQGFGYGYGWLDWMRSHPYLTAGIIATAIAVPVAIAADHDSNS